MSAIKQYFREEAKVQMLVLGHPKPSDFYLSVWQTTRSAVPLLIWRSFLFLVSLGVVLASLILYILASKAGYWFIYLTHWGLTINTLATGFAVVVSARCYLYGPIIHEEEELNHALDVSVHGVNSLVMFGLLISASQPSRMWHIYQPLQFAILYVIFSAIYYAAGGVDPSGNRWIYSVVDWSSPGTTIGLVALTGLLLAVLHFVVMGLAVARDALASKLFHDSVTVHGAEGVPLRRRPSQIQTSNA
ncbi:protein rolling stone-like isoform X2 [Cydia fagiglandana]|uniref:protein rolling stone-like isoform X2 n=1 Tax=Cydia fagiglandana TaxID=1458189 RepID=UPI002FEE1177